MRRALRSVVRVLTALAVASSIAVAVAPQRADAQATGCPSVGEDFASAGPFAVTVETAAEHTYYSPTDLGSQGCTRHPVILWGNGTFVGPDAYDALLRHLASHGFIVAAANTTNAGTGVEMLAGLDNLTTFNNTSGNRYFQKVDLENVGATGHSQGGGGAINAGKDPRVDVIFPMQPWLQDQVGLEAVSLFFAGSADTIISPASVRARYDDVQGRLPAAYAELAGADHLVPLGNAGGFRGPATAWARWLLMDDVNAQDEFVGAGCGLCTDGTWTYEHNQLLEDLAAGEPGDPGDPGDPGRGCVTAANSAHVSEGRATSWFFFFAIAAGSGDFLGFSFSTTSLEESSPGVWDLVDAC